MSVNLKKPLLQDSELSMADSHANANIAEAVQTDSELSHTQSGMKEIKVIRPTTNSVTEDATEIAGDNIASTANTDTNTNTNNTNPNNYSQHDKKSTVLTINELTDDINKEITKIKVLSWNVWAVPFGAPRTLTNPIYCANYLRSLGKKEKWDEFDGLIIAGIQEVWSWKTGLFPFFLLPIIGFIEIIPCGIGYVLSILIQFVSALCGLIPPFKCMPYLTHNPKRFFRWIMKKYLPFSYSKSNIPLKHIIDNGLLLLSNVKPDKCGMKGYRNMACDDSIAYKGFIWMYFKEKYNVLALTTHLQSAGTGNERLAQVDELTDFIDEFIEKYGKVDSKNRPLKIIAFGDFNVDMTNHVAIVNERIRAGTRKAKMKLNEVERKKRIETDLEEKTKENELDLHINNSEIQISEEPPEKKQESNYNKNENENENKYKDKNANSNEIDIPFGAHTSQLSMEAKPKPTPKKKKKSKKSRHKIDLSSSLRHGMIQIDDALINAFQSNTGDGYLDRRYSLRIERHRSYADLPMILGNNFKKINTFESTHRRTHAMSGAGGCLDHIFVNFETSNVENQLLGQEGGLSDHLLTTATFEC